MYRSFWLVNNLGEKWDITDSNTFGINPEGLGIRNNYSTIRIGDSDILTYQQWDLLPFTINLMFMGTNEEQYKRYRDFLLFISKVPILQYYKTPNNLKANYFRQVIIDTLDKTEVSVDTGTLNCQLTIKPQTFWESAREEIIEVNSSVGDGKIYELQRPYHYSGNSVNQINIVNNSVQDVPLIIEIDGSVEDPVCNIFDEKGEIYSSGKFIGTFDYVYVDARDLTQEIVLKQGDSVLPNPTSYQDLTVGSPNEIYVTFMKLKPGNSTIQFLFSNTFDGLVRISWRNQYASV